MSFWEIILIILVAIVVIKPERLPETAYLLGRLVAHFKRWYQNIIGKYTQLM